MSSTRFPLLTCLLMTLGVSANADPLLGGISYSGRMDSQAFSHPMSILSSAEKLDFVVGKGFFKRLWVAAPTATQAADGLGPLYNARSCMLCHPNNGRGHPPQQSDEHAVSMFLRVDIPPQNEADRQALAGQRVGNIPDPVYGLQLQHFAIPGQPAEYRLAIHYQEIPVTLADGEVVQLRQPRYQATQLGYGPLHPQARLSPRVAPELVGLGLLAAIDEAEILAQADADDRDGDGISGRANWVWSRAGQRVQLGRFGHKALTATLDEQSQSAFNNDIGLSTPLYPAGSGECTAAQSICQQTLNGNSPQYDQLEAPRQVTDLVLHYLRHLAVPARRNPDDPEVVAGEQLFHASGCADCHRPRFVTGASPEAPHLAQHTISPYSDLLLHDLGEGLADRRPEAQADGREWRTAPLWGIGLTPLVSGHSLYLHDGRARSLLEAILWHAGEAQAARDAVTRLSTRQRSQLLRFIESL